jgi:putative acetyltransferase
VSGVFYPTEPTPELRPRILTNGAVIGLRTPMLRDAGALCALNATLVADGRGMVMGREDLGDVRTAAAQIGALRDAGDLQLVAFVGDTLLGTVDVRRIPVASLRHNGTLTMGVHPDHQGLGLGRILLHEAMLGAKSLGVRRLELACLAANHRARTLYESAGFVTQCVRHDFVRWPDGRLEDDISMVCDLTQPLTWVRPEQPSDAEPLARLHQAAFPTRAEASLVAGLRDQGAIALSRVRSVDGEAVAHALFSRMVHEPASGPPATLFALAPLAVHPQAQRQGHGTALLGACLQTLARVGIDGVVLLGDPAFYGRLGFIPADEVGLHWLPELPPGALQVYPLGSQGIQPGQIHYHPLIEGLDAPGDRGHP